jgi:hypothetical protein
VVAAEGVEVLAHEWRRLRQGRVVDHVPICAQSLDQLADAPDV